MTKIIIPLEQDIQVLRDQVNRAERINEYNRLKSDLQGLMNVAVNTPNEFEGGMKIVDTEAVLKTKRNANNIFDLIFHRLGTMFALRPVIGNMISLVLTLTVLFYIFNYLDGTMYAKYKNYFAVGIQLTAALQIIKSGTRSLILPFLALVIGAMVSQTLGDNQSLLHFNKLFYQHLMVVGMIGLGVSIMSID